MPIDPAPANRHDTLFEAQRARLLALAWRMLGSRHEAQDLLQDLWLAWHGVELASLSEPAAYLTRMATHLCIDRLRSARRQREQYVGVWLPEPWIESAEPLDAPPTPAEQLGLAQSVSIAFLLVLERLGPPERAAFLLHDVFEQPFEEVARLIGRSAVACRQLAARARARLRAAGLLGQESARENTLTAVSAHAAQLLEAFGQAVGSGDVDRLAALLARDVELLSDGGGVVTALPRPVSGAYDVARVLCGLARGWARGAGHHERLAPVRINGLPGVVVRDAGGQVVMALALQQNADGRVRGVYFMRNPHRLHAVAVTRGAHLQG